MKAAVLLGHDWTQARWSYAGLNHRGFITRLSWNSTDEIRHVAAALGNATLDGITSDDIRMLSSIPTKYFRLLRNRGPSEGGGRAAIVERLRTMLLRELAASSVALPSSLGLRNLAWYPHAVVPFVEAIHSARATLLELNVLAKNGLVEEGRAIVSKTGISPHPRDEVPAAAHAWIERFRGHEQLVLSAVERPSLQSIQRALDNDPLIIPSAAEDCARTIWANVRGAGQRSL
jgi:6-phospho-beta-glucosidase